MSKVISFRLNPDNPREASALSVLQDWLTQGYSVRHTMTEALLKLDLENSQKSDNKALSVLSQRINELLDSIEGGIPPLIPSDTVSANEKPTDGFVYSMRKAARPGLRSELK